MGSEKGAIRWRGGVIQIPVGEAGRRCLTVAACLGPLVSNELATAVRSANPHATDGGWRRWAGSPGPWIPAALIPNGVWARALPHGCGVCRADPLSVRTHLDHRLPQQRLNFLPLPHGQRSLGPAEATARMRSPSRIVAITSDGGWPAEIRADMRFM